MGSLKIFSYICSQAFLCEFSKYLNIMISNDVNVHCQQILWKAACQDQESFILDDINLEAAAAVLTILPTFEAL